MNKKLLFLLPLFAFVLLAGFLAKGLFSNPREIESALVGKPLPEFVLNDLMTPSQQWTAEQLRGEPALINVWGVWCPTCNAELGYLTALKQQGVKIVGVYFEQYDPDFDGSFNLAALQHEVASKLAETGNPYAFNIFDAKRSLALDLGVSGAPETFVIDRNGIIRAHHIGDINPNVWRSKLAPLWQELIAESQGQLSQHAALSLQEPHS